MLPARSIRRRGNQMKFTVKSLASFSVPKGKADHIEFDDALSGFGIRFRNGKASWIFQWSIGSGVTRRTTRMKIGIYPALPLEQARKIAAELNSKITLGHDPSAEKRERIEEAQHVAPSHRVRSSPTGHPPTAGTACASLRRSGGYEAQSFTGAVDKILSYRAR